MNITVPFNKLKKIVHLADIHIRLFKRHEEYNECFQTFYNQLRQEDLTDSVIVVAGDIVHAKTDMSPEMVVMATEFLKTLADIAPTIIIAGNHDLNLSNMNRLDSLTPIVNSINHKHLHYFKHSGVYTIADTDFSVYSILDEKEKWPSHKDCSSRRKVALYHGPVFGATTDAKYTITNRHVDVSVFTGFDMVLLGDIHKHQVLQERDAETKKPVVVYASSLIQQNHGESVDNHGWCMWDVNNCTFQFRPLPNNYGYYTVEVHGGKVPVLTDVPKNVRMRIFTGNLDTSAVKKLTAVLRKQHNIIELSINKSRYDSSNREKMKSGIEIIDVQNINNQNQLIQDWLERQYDNTIDKPLMDKILDVNKNLNAQTTHDDQSRNVNWRPLQLKFSNMFSYGEDNVINFGKMRGIYGIFAQNASGKSSAMDSLIFALYDKTPRAFRGDHIMNNRKDTFACQLKFEINNEIFYIRRTGTRKKTGDVKVDVSFWRENEDGTHESLNGEDRRDTNANIRNYVGTYEDFVLTTLSSQNSNAVFIDKSHSERKDLLIQFMGLSIFDKLCDTANDEMKEISGALRKFKKIDFSQTLSDTQCKLDTTREEHERIEGVFSRIKQEQETLYEKLTGLQEQKRTVPNIELDIDTLLSTKDKVVDLVASYEQGKGDAEQRLQYIHDTIKEKTTEVVDADIPSLRKDVEEHTRLTELLGKGSNALKLTTSKIGEKEKFKKKLESYKYNPNCNVCVENNKSVIDDMESVTHELIDLYELQSKQEDAVSEIKQQIEPLIDSVNRCAYYEKIQSEIQQLQKKASGVELEIQKILTNIEKCDRKREQVENDIELHRSNKENIEYNIEINGRIDHIQYDINTSKKKADYMETVVRDLHGEIKVLEATKTDIMNQIKEAEELEATYEAYKYYMEAVGRDGIPYDLMSKAIPTIEAEINNILTQIVDFTISLEVDGKNIVGKLNYDYDRVWPLENSSGMERFISSLAIRVALMNASNLPKSNFLIIDEGLGTLDAENMTSMHTLFGILKAQFDFLIVISHLDVVRDMVDNLIEIKREDGFSFINN
jgi:DNA repair exonuclease SbcCD ATPase subunit